MATPKTRGEHHARRRHHRSLPRPGPRARHGSSPAASGTSCWTPAAPTTSGPSRRSSRAARTTPWPATSPIPCTGRARRRRPRARRRVAAGQQREHAWAPARCRPSRDLDPATYVDILRVNLVAPMALTAGPAPPAAAKRRDGSSTSPPTPPSSPTRPGAATARRRPRSTTPAGCWPPRSRRCASTPSTPATCAPGCTRTRSRARTSPTGPSPRPWSRRCCPCWTATCPAAATSPASSCSEAA